MWGNFLLYGLLVLFSNEVRSYQPTEQASGWKPASEANSDFELLERTRDTFAGWIRFRVGVSEYVDVSRTKAIICQVLDGEELDGFRRVTVTVHDLRSVEGIPVEARFLASYIWSKTTIDKLTTMPLEIYVDPDGNDYPYEERPEFRFIHRTDCEYSK